MICVCINNYYFQLVDNKVCCISFLINIVPYQSDKPNTILYSSYDVHVP